MAKTNKLLDHLNQSGAFTYLGAIFVTIFQTFYVFFHDGPGDEKIRAAW